MTGKKMFPAVAGWLRSYPLSWLPVDCVAGLTAAAVVIPKAMACSVIAGLPIQTGLYTALAALLVYPFLGTSSVLSVTTTSTIALMTAAQVATMGTGVSPVAVGITLAFLVGVFLILARIFCLGFVANFISKPVLVGFEAGIGIVIAVSQLKSILGVQVAGHSTLQILWALPGALMYTHLLTFAVALMGIALLYILPRAVPMLSAPLVLVVVSALATFLFHLGDLGVKLSGNVPPGLPLFMWPDLALVHTLWPAALGIALMSFTESVASARTFMRREDPPINANRELLAIGSANIAAACFGGFAVGGGASQTAVNAKAGARTQMAQLVTAAVVVLCLLFLSQAIGFLPQAALGALVFVVAVGMIKPDHFWAIGRIRKDEMYWALVTMIGVVCIGTLEGILIAVAISILTILFHANHPPVYAVAYNRQKDIFRRVGEHDGDETFPGLLMLRTEGRLSFANVANAVEKMKALVDETQPQVIVMECSAIPDVEYTALITIIEAEQRLRERGVSLWLAALNPDLLKIIKHSPLGETLGHERMFYDLHKALEAYKSR